MNGLGNIKLIACDFDQTLFMPEIAFPDETMKYIRHLHDLGIQFVIVSGRTPNEMKLLLEEKGVNWANPFPDFLICMEKYILNTQGQALNEQAEQWNKQVSQNKLKADALKDIFVELLSSLNKEGIPLESYSFSSRSGIELICPQPELADKARKIVKNFITGKIDETKFIISGNLYSIAITPSWPTKGDTLQFLATNILGLKEKQVLAIGDHINDIPMLDGNKGFVSATVINAHSDVKSLVEQVHGIIANKIGPAGVGEILKQIYHEHIQNK